MTGDIPPCRPTAVVTPGDPNERRGEQGQPRRQKPAPARPHDRQQDPADLADPAAPSRIGMLIDVRV